MSGKLSKTGKERSTRKYKSTEKDIKSLEKKVNDYFGKCDIENEPYSIPALALFLGFSSSSQMLEYSKQPNHIGDCLKKARLKIEANTLKMALKTNGAGPIFILKNMGYSDRQDLTVAGTPAININADAIFAQLGIGLDSEKKGRNV